MKAIPRLIWMSSLLVAALGGFVSTAQAISIPIIVPPIVADGKPGAPTIAEVIPGNEELTVSFVPPSKIGSSPISAYVITLSGEGFIVIKQVSASPYIITGLKNGQSYIVTVAAINGSGTGPASTPSGPTSPSMTAVAKKYYYVQTDHLNTPRQITSTNGTTMWQWQNLDPFGNNQATSPGGLVFNQRFPGQYYDVESGLHYNGFRDYNPAIGRYVQSDPIGLMAGVNTYGYVEGNPLTHSDYFGLSVRPGLTWENKWDYMADLFRLAEDTPTDETIYTWIKRSMFAADRVSPISIPWGLANPEMIKQGYMAAPAGPVGIFLELTIGELMYPNETGGDRICYNGKMYAPDTIDYWMLVNPQKIGSNKPPVLSPQQIEKCRCSVPDIMDDPDFDSTMHLPIMP